LAVEQLVRENVSNAAAGAAIGRLQGAITGWNAFTAQ
jgi:hypothetical protein